MWIAPSGYSHLASIDLKTHLEPFSGEGDLEAGDLLPAFPLGALPFRPDCSLGSLLRLRPDDCAPLGDPPAGVFIPLGEAPSGLWLLDRAVAAVAGGLRPP